MRFSTSAYVCDIPLRARMLGELLADFGRGAFRHAVSPFSGEAASTPMVAFQANPDLVAEVGIQASVSRPLSDRVDRRLPRSVWYRPRSYPGYLYKPRFTVVARKVLAEFDGWAEDGLV